MEPENIDRVSGTPRGSRAALQVILALLGVAAAAWVLDRLERVVLVLAVAIFFAYVVAPLVRFAERPVRVAGRSRRVSRGPAIGLVYVAILVGVGGGTAILVPTLTKQLAEAVSQAPAYGESFRAWAEGWSGSYERFRLPLEVREGINRSAVQVGEAVVEYGRGALVATVGVAAYLPWLILVPILAFFFLKDADGFRRSAVLALPHRVRRRGYALFKELNATLAAYIRAQLLACVLVGGLCGVGTPRLACPTRCCSACSPASWSSCRSSGRSSPPSSRSSSPRCTRRCWPSGSADSSSCSESSKITWCTLASFAAASTCTRWP